MAPVCLNYLRKMFGVTGFVSHVYFVMSGDHDEHLPSVYGGRVNGEEVRWQHQKGLCSENTKYLITPNLLIFIFSDVYSTLQHLI